MKVQSQNILSVQNEYPRLVQYLIEVCQATDCHLVTCSNNDGCKTIVAYIAGSSRYNIEQLNCAANQGLIERSPDFIAPVTEIPYTANGIADLEALSRYPVIDDQFIHSQHIKSLGPKPLSALPLAQISGGPLPPDPLKRQTLADALRHAAKGEHGVRFIIDEHNSNRISYRDLLVRAEAMARRLVPHLSGSLSPVVVQTASLADTVVTSWTAWFAGTSCVPLPPCRDLSTQDKNATSLRRILKLFPGAIVVTDGECREPFARHFAEHSLGDFPVLAFDELARGLENDGAGNIELPQVNGDDIALYIMTSGSTSKPKIVPQSHIRILNRNRASWLSNHFDEQSVSLNWLPLDHGGGILAFLIGNTVLAHEQIHCPTEFVLQDPLRWLALCDQYQVTSSWAPDFAFALVNARADEVKLKHWDLSRLDFIINGGEAIVATQSHAFIALLAQHGLSANAIIPSYGMTEICTGVTFSHHFSDTPKDAEFTGLGRPIPGIELRIVNDTGDLVRFHQRGHLQVCGDCVLTHYYQNPEVNAASFTVDGWFDTGDLGFIDEQGLTLVGRTKDILIINGHNIACHVIEATIGQVKNVEPSYTCVFAHPDRQTGVEGAMVAIHSHRRDDRTIAELASAIQLVLQKEHSITLHKLYVLEADQFEKTAIGKLQRNKLLAILNSGSLLPAWQHSAQAHENSQEQQAIKDPFSNPATISSLTNDAPQLAQVDGKKDIETRLCQLWQKLLPVAKVGPHDNFFLCGGDSLLAIRLCYCISEELSVEAPVALLFQYPTVAGLAPQLNRQMSFIEARKLNHGPMSSTQQRLWFIEQYEQGASAYHAPLLFQLAAAATGEQLIRALQLLVVRHPILRTHFFLDGHGQRIQQVSEGALAIKRRQVQPDELNDALTEAIQTPFDLSHDYPLRVVLFSAGGQHILLLLFHHIAVDGWSMEILCRELAQLNQAGVTDIPGMEARLPPLPIDYLDFTLWQQKTWQQNLMEHQSQWWQQQLAGLEPLNLPLDYPRPQQFDYRGRCCQFTLAKELSGQLQQLARNEQTTIYAVMLSAFALLLSRYSGQDDLAVGSPITNRHHPQLEPLVGFFANTLVVRTTLRPEQRFRELVSRVHSTVSDMQQYQEIPFEQLVDQLAVERDPSRNALFQVLFAVQHFALTDHWTGSNTVHPMPIPDQAATAKFDLTLVIDDSGDQFTAMVEYPIALFHTATIERLWRHYVQILEQVVAEPDSRLQDISLLTPDEYQQIVVDWNHTDTELPARQQDLLLHQLFEQQAEQSPDDVCLIFEGQKLSNREVNDRANQLALTIQKQIKENNGGHIPPETCVVVCCEPGPQINIAALAVLKAGCVYVPVNHNEAPERIGFILTETAAPVVLATSGHATLLADKPSIQTLALDRYFWCNAGHAQPQLTVQPDALACIIFTSGTTGKPKGVMIPHGALVNRIQDSLSRFVAMDDDVFIQRMPHSFDFSLWELFLFMAASAPAVIAPQDSRYDSGLMDSLMEKHAVTVMMAVPSFLEALCHFLYQRNRALPMSLRLIIASGETLPTNVANQLLQLATHPSFILINAYGITEITIYATVYQYAGQLPESGLTPIGRPISNTRFFVLDHCGQPLPPKVPGELYIAGVGVTRGYLHRPDLTEAAFVSNPFASPEDLRLGYGRLYRTGDRVQWQDNGELQYIGRTDHQVKIRGYRIEPAEIEQTMQALAGIVQAVVLPRSRREVSASDPHHYDYLVAWYIADRPLDEAILREQLSQKLPAYMVPVAYMPVDRFPVTANGKLDTHALPEPELHATDHYVAPTTATEARLCQLWQTLLAVETVGLHDNFFHLGGDSLLAIRLCQQISSDLLVEAPVALLFQYPTVAGLAPQLTQQMAQIPARGLTYGPMSFTQQRLWFIEQFEQGTSAYHIPLPLRLKRQADGEQLVKAVQLLTSRHPALRTRFFMDDQGQRTQQVGENTLTVERREVTQEALDDTMVEVINTPFKLDRDYPVRAVLFTTGECQVLLLLFHHIAVDGWSLDILCRELAQLCQNDVTDKIAMEALLPPLAIDYLDFTLWQRETWQKSLMERQSQWWQQQLAGLEPLNLPLDYPRPQQFDYRGQRCRFTLAKTLSAQLQQLARDQQTTLYAVMLSAFALLLSRYSGQDDLAVGSPVANRHHPQLEPLVGFFANTLVVRTNLNPRHTFQELVSRVHDTVTDMQQYQEIPFEQLVEQLGVDRDPSRTPLFQVMFAVQHFALANHWSGSDIIQPVSIPDQAATAKFDLTLIIDDNGDSFIGWIEYPVALFQGATIERLWQRYVLILEQVVAEPDSRLQDISLLSPGEYQQIVVDWNHTDAQLSAGEQNLLLHQLFEWQAEQSPDNICLIFADQQLTNWEVNNRANRLALTIQEKTKENNNGTVPPDTCVVVCCQPGLEINIAALAVLKAGCVYVPVNHSEAPERVGFIIKDTKTPLVLTTSQYSWLLADDAPYSALALDLYPWPGAITKAPKLTATPEMLAYIIYTSGTTGHPKGVMVRHKSVVNFILDCLQRFEVLDDDVFLQRTAHGFDATIWEIFWSMATACPTVVASQEARQDVRLLLNIIDQRRVSVTIMVPSILEEIILWMEQNQRAMPTSMRMLACIGEPLSATLANRTLSLCSGHGCLYNVYGPAEATIHVTTRQYWQDQQHHGDVPIGKGIANTRLYVLDNWHNPVPVGIDGSLYLGGIALATGYLHRPDLTAAAFVSNPFASPEDQRLGYDRLYRTGDRVRWLDSGELLYVGREDQQIKIRGLRIEPGEIEQCLESIAGIHQAVVLPRSRQTSSGDAPGHYNYLVAWYIAERSLDEAELQGQLRQKLPAYMLPAVYMPVDSFPVTANGKLNAKALPEPTLHITDDYVAPTNATEARLCQLWQTLLAVEAVGLHDNFFHLGGDSLLAIRLCQKISNEFSVEAPVALLFQYPTVARLAPQLTRQVTPIPARRLTHGPMSFTQQRLWFIEQYEQGTSAYHIPLLFRLTGQDDGELLIRAMQLLAERHTALRTHFFMDDNGRRTQQVGENTINVERREISMDELANALTQMISIPFDLSRDYPVRVVLLTTGNSQVLLLLFHHIAVDGWSLDILHQELATLYQAKVSEKTAMAELLTPLGIDYLDFTLWQQEAWQQCLMERQSQWWQQQLTGLEPLNLPLDYPRPQQFNYRGQRCQFTLAKELSTQLQQLARARQTTLYTVMLSAFALLLSRYSGQNDLAVGSPVANRHHPQLEPLVGFFANTLMVRTTVNGQQSFLELVSRVHNTVADMQQYQEIPFKQLVEQLDVERDPSRTPLFQVMFAVQHFANHWSGSSTVQPMPIPNQAATAKFDLTLVIDDSGDAFTGWIEYPLALFRTDTIERLWQRYVLVLEQVTAKPDIRLDDISLLSSDEYQQIVVDWNHTDTEPVAGQQNLLLHQLFEQQARQSPDNICLIFANQQLTNREVNNRANQLALDIRKHIKENGDGTVPPETCVTVCCEPGPQINIAALAVLKAGCVYVPVNHYEAPGRIRFILDDTASPLVLTTSRHTWLLADNPTFKAIALDVYPWSDTISATVDSGATPETLAYIIYTSGTTGEPKGIMTTHQAFVCRILDTLSRFPTRQNDVFMQRLPHGFDVSLLELFWAMGAPFPALIAPRDSHYDPGLLIDLIEKYAVTFLIAAPSSLKAWCDWLTGQNKTLPTSLRLIISGGESLERSLANQLQQLAPHHDFTLFNVYGPSEACVYATAHQFHPSDNGPVAIGAPIANTRLYVLDNSGQPQPCRVPGELYIGGSALAKGYLHQPKLTKAAFVDNPFALPEDSDHDRIYRTGDRVQWQDNGELLYIGREDQQIKIRGFRIEPGETERCLERIDGIRRAVVLPRSRQKNTAPGHYDYLVAWYIAGQPIDDGKLREQLSQELPAYMVPAAYVPVDSFPVTANGKLDAKALPEPELYIADDYVAPGNATEARLCQLWQSSLAVGRVGIHDNFFHLGGDSLLAIRLCQQISSDLAVEVPVSLLFQYPTVAGLVPRLTRRMARIPAKRLTTGPMSFAQQRLWFIEQYEQGTSTYHIPLLLRLKGKTAGERLTKAVQLLADRHPALRTRFFMDDQGYRTQQVGENTLTVEHREVAQDELNNALTEVISTPFELERGCPLRMMLFNAGDQYVLLLLFHHIAVDGWSLEILCREMAMLYQTGVTDTTGMAALLPPLGIDCLDVTLWQQEARQQNLMEHQSQWWHQQLAGLEPLNLPLDCPRPQQFDHRGQLSQFTLPQKLSVQLRQLARDGQTTIYTVMLSAFALLLSRYSGQDDLTVGSPVANRHHPQLEPLVGFFANTLVVRITLDSGQSFRELVSGVHNTVTDLQQYQGIPFEQLVEQLDVERDPSRTPLFQVMFAVQHFNLAEHWSGSDTVQPIPIPDQAATAKFDLTLIIDDSDDQFTGWVEYPVALFRAATIERLWNHYVRVLEQVAVDPDIQLNHISLLSHDEYQQIVVDWNRTDIEPAPEQQNLLLHQLFEQQARQSPNDICLIFNNQKLTNQEVNNRANQLARTIREQVKENNDGHIPPETCVVVCCEPCPQINIAALAVLKAGCVYVPVNHYEAPERIRFILADTASPLVLTTSQHEQLLPVGNSAFKVLALDLYPWSDAVQATPSHTASAETLAYIIYTSGTTGKPKGVMTTHKAFVNRILDTLARFPMQDGDVFIQRQPHGFDFSLWELFWHMATAFPALIAPQDSRYDPALLGNLIEKYAVTILMAVPSSLKTWRDWVTGQNSNLPPSLRLVISGAESLDCTLASQLTQLAPHHDFTLFNAYGPSEASVYATVHQFSGHHAENGTLPIGSAVANTRLYVLDSNGLPQPCRIPGDLYLGGSGLARGYLNRPELTKAAFVNNPFASPEDTRLGYDRLYRTGDRVQWLDNGELLYIGREDQQVKIRGFRIEPGEIAQCLERIKGIRQALVLPRSWQKTSAPGHYDYLVAWYIADQLMDAAILREQLSQELPAYMLPVTYIPVGSFPVTANGKIDTGALPEPELRLSDDYVAPTNATETRLCQLWQSLLTVGQIGVHDNFFHLGGDSLLAVRLSQQISNDLSTNVPVALLFDHPTVAELALHLTGQVSSIPAQGLEYGPISSAQQQVWLLGRFAQGTSAYHIPLLLRLDRDTNADRLIRVLQLLADRHTALRTRFPINDQGKPIQQVGENTINVQHRKLAQEELGDALATIFSTSFDLNRDCPMRITLLTTDKCQVLQLLFHHIAIDGWSLDILCRETATLYQAGVTDKTGMEALLPSLTIDYLDFTLWQQNLIEPHSQWWQQQLAGLEPLNLPLDAPRPQHFDCRGRHYPFTLAASLSGQLQQLARNQQTTLYTVMLAAFALLLGRYSGQNDLAVGTPIANRTHPQLETLVGLLANVLVVRTVLDPQQSFRELVSDIHDTVTEMQQHQLIPFAQLVDQLAVERDLSRTPLCQVTFTVQHFDMADHLSGIATVDPISLPDWAIAVKYDLSLSINDSRSPLTGLVEYSAALFRGDTIERLVDHYVQILEQVAAEPDIRLRDIDLLTPDRKITVDCR